jgi:hypothetical protein
VTRTRAEEYRRLAEECRVAAQSAWTEEVRVALLETARGWLRLAEEQDASADLWGSVPPTSVEEARPVVQQQQQAQPKDDEKD